MFTFKQFTIDDSHCGMKLGTDSVALGAWVDGRDCRSAIDVGAGCGILTLMLCQRFPVLRIKAVEIDPGACADCRANFAGSPWADRLEVIERSFEEYVPELAGQKSGVDLIISNPPYFATGERASRRNRSQARHQSALSIDSLIEYAAEHLTANGSLAFIMPAEGADNYVYSAEMAGLKLRRLAWLKNRPESAPIRVMMQVGRLDGPIEPAAIAVCSAEFARMTKDFYL